MNKENEFFEIGFRFKDVYGNETKVDKTIQTNSCYVGDLYELLEQFRLFLVCAGFSLPTKSLDFVDDTYDD